MFGKGWKTKFTFVEKKNACRVENVGRVGGRGVGVAFFICRIICE